MRGCLLAIAIITLTIGCAPKGAAPTPPAVPPLAAMRARVVGCGTQAIAVPIARVAGEWHLYAAPTCGAYDAPGCRVAAEAGKVAFLACQWDHAPRDWRPPERAQPDAATVIVCPDGAAYPVGAAPCPYGTAWTGDRLAGLWTGEQVEAVPLPSAAVDASGILCVSATVREQVRGGCIIIPLSPGLRAAIERTVTVECIGPDGAARGSGLIERADGWEAQVWTAAHLVAHEGCQPSLEGGGLCHVATWDRTRDTALITCPTRSTLPPLPPLPPSPLSRTYYTCPGAGDLAPRTGYVIGPLPVGQDDDPVWVLAGQVDYGCSGAPIIDQHGNWVAILTAGDVAGGRFLATRPPEVTRDGA